MTGQLRAGGLLTAMRLARTMPEAGARRTFEILADGVYATNGRGVQRLRANLARAVDSGDLEDTVHAGMRSYLRYWCETFRLPALLPAELVRHTRVVDGHLLRAAAESGNGVVVALPHMGNWDWAGAWASAEVRPLTTVAERLRPEWLHRMLTAHRAGLGLEVLPLTGGPRPMPRLADRLRSGGLVGLLADRDLTGRGVPMDLLGEPAMLPVGPALLARRTGAALVPASLHYDAETLVLRFHRPVPHEEVGTMSQRLADAFTNGIREHPQDWHMMQPVFVTDRERAR